MILNDVCYYVKDKRTTEGINAYNYVTTDNMLPNKSGIASSEYLPEGNTVNSFQKGDVLLSNIRPYFKKIWLADKDGGCCADVLVLRPKNISSELLYAYLSQDAFFEYDTKGAKGSKMPRGDKDHIMKFPLKELKNGTEVGHIIQNIDKKIALNNKTNTELENMAKTIYDYWFTQFDFPDKNGHPYKTSGGQMVYNEILKREIPAGWEVKSLSQICELQRGVTYGKDDEMSESDENVVQILRGNNISNNHIVYDSNTVYVSSDLVTKEQKIKKFDVVITMSSGSKEHVGKSAMFLFDSPHSYGAFCNKLTPINESQFFVENFMHSDFFKTYINHVCIGTGINNLKGEHFDKAYFAYPTDSVLKQFNEIMKPIYEKRSYMEQANEELTKLRDYLLPLLMNGQIEVK